MIAFKYTKTDGAEYLSHLDLLRHIDRTLRRAGIAVKYSEGFNKHPRIFMNNPLGTGIKSVAEYCTIDADYAGDFMQAFNAHSPKGVKCLAYRQAAENANFANTIERCLYRAQGVAPFDPQTILSEASIEITDSRGRNVDIRPRIYAIERKSDGLYLTLGCGEKNLRPDLLCEYLCGRFGGTTGEIIKLECFGENVF